MSALARLARAALLAAPWALEPAAGGAETPALPPGTVIEWRSPELTRAGRSDDWMRQRILAIESASIRYSEEEEKDRSHRSEVTRIAYRGLVAL